MSLNDLASNGSNINIRNMNTSVENNIQKRKTLQRTKEFADDKPDDAGKKDSKSGQLKKAAPEEQR